MAFEQGCVVQLKSDPTVQGKIADILYDPVYKVTWTDKPDARPCYMRDELTSMTPVTFNRKAKIGAALLLVMLIIIVIVAVHSRLDSRHRHPNRHHAHRHH